MLSSMNPTEKTLQFPEVRVVEASAGSGKTFALAKRYVQLLLDPCIVQKEIRIRHILAITFTNKASVEMKTRILLFLKSIALEKLSKNEEEQILGTLGLTQKEASLRAFAVMEELIHNYNFFQVQTIDSFINALLSGCAFKIGLSANFRIKQNSFDYIEYSLDQMIEMAASDNDFYKIFTSFLDQYLFLENKSGWFPKKDMLELLIALHYQASIYGQAFVPYAIRMDDLILKKQKILESIRQLSKNLPKGIDSRFAKSLDGFLTKYNKSFDFDSLSDFFARDHLPVNKNTFVPSPTEKLWAGIHKKIVSLSELEAYSLFNPYVEVFNVVSEIFKEKASKDDVLFLEELNKKARSLFDEGMVTVEELYYRLATRFHHYLIDEFQDTSVLQWKNLYLMIEEALSSGGSLFYVGDKKQAIYQFRGGEVELFDRVQEAFKSFNVQKEILEKNYRSQKAIVDFNNKIFSYENLEGFIARKEQYETQKKKDIMHFYDEDLGQLKSIYHSSTQDYRKEKDGGYVSVEYITSEKKENRDEIVRKKLLEKIKSLKERYSYSDIAILTRGNKEIERITSWLMEEGIFVESERTLNVKENKIVGELIAFAKFLNSPIDNISFAQFILGDVFACASGIKKQELHEFVFSLRERIHTEKDIYLYKEFREAYSKAWDALLAEFFKNVGLYPLYELMVTIVGCMKVLKNFGDSQGFVMKFLEIIKLKEEETSDIATFLEVFDKMEGEDLYVNVSDADAVKVLTIHKAKGLEFPVVIAPFLGMNIHVGSSSSGDMGQRSYIMHPREGHLQLMRIKSKYTKFSDELKEIRRKEYIKSFIAEVNSIYVALTRASEELHIYIPNKISNSFNLVHFLIPEDSLKAGTPMGRKKKEFSSQERRLSLPPSEYYDWIEFLKEEFVDIGDLSRRLKIRKGNILHFLLSQVGNLSGQNRQEILQSAIKRTKEHFIHIDELGEYENIASQVLEKEEFKNFFYVPDGEVYQEIDVVNQGGHTKRLDRLIIKDKEVWIIDFKSSHEAEEEHQAQVKEYIKIVEGIYPQKQIKGFLVYLDDLMIKHVVG